VSTAENPSFSAGNRSLAHQHRRSTRWIHWAALVVTLFAASHAWTKGPYTQHVDEHFLLKASHKMLQSGNFDPGWYRYGSVSLHICFLGEALGYLDHARHSKWTPVSDLTKAVVPLMRPSRLGSWPRLLFAILGGLAVLFAGLSADRLRPKSGAGPLAIVVLASQLGFQGQWFGYLNVDIVASFFAMAALYAHLSAPREAAWLRTSALPAALWGMAAATKYPVGVGVLSVIAADLLRRNRSSAMHALASLVVALRAFLVAMPFAVRNSPVFLSDLAFEFSHYAKGHLDFSSQPGIDAAWHHIKAWLLPLGPAIAVTLFGVVITLRDYPSRLFTLLGPSLALVALLSLQSTNFTRNSLLLGYLFSILAGVGAAAIYPWLFQTLGKANFTWLKRPWVRHSLATLALACVLLGAQHRGLAQLVRGHQESRDDVQAQLDKLPRNALVAIPHPDFMAAQSVRLVNYDPTLAPDLALAQLAQSQATHAIVPTNWSRARYRGEAPIKRALTNAQNLKLPGETIWQGGVDETWVHWPFHPRGNPKLKLVVLDRTRLTASTPPLKQ